MCETNEEHKNKITQQIEIFFSNGKTVDFCGQTKYFNCVKSKSPEKFRCGETKQKNLSKNTSPGVVFCTNLDQNGKIRAKIGGKSGKGDFSLNLEHSENKR